MTFQDYQTISRTTAQYKDLGNNYIYPTLGVAGEAGEVAEKVKKILRNDGGVISDAAKEGVAGELGDLLWYMAQLATELGLSLEDIAAANMVKLKDRVTRGVIASTGDHR